MSSSVVRWCRAVDVPSWKPKFFNYKPKNPEKFERFNDFDNQQLEAAFKADKQRQVVMADGLFSVNLKDRLLEPTYWNGPKFKVIRGTWFKQPSMQPLNEDIATKLEDLWKRYQTDFNAHTKRTVKLNDKEIIFADKDGVVTASMDGTFLDSIRSLGPAKTVYVRGYNPPNQLIESIKSTLPTGQATKEETESTGTEPTNERDREIDHLVFCVHGIGQKLGVRFDFVSFIKDTGALRTGIHKAFQQSPEAQKIVGEKTNDKVQVLPVLWRQTWEFEGGKRNPELKGITPESIFYRDNVLADVVLDFVMYTQADLRNEIQRITIDLINEEYKRFCELHPKFAANPKVSIVGHSLGSVIADDLHRYEENPFLFTTENLFLLGSPVGVLDLINGKRFNKKDSFAKNIYNIMRPSDPVASRLEPMVVGEKAKEVVPMPLNRNDDSLIGSIVDSIHSVAGYTTKLANNVNGVWQTLSTALVNDVTKPDEVSLKPVPQDTLQTMEEELKPFNRHRRLDFSIPESIEISLAIGLAGHMTYLESPEVAAFVLQELYKVGNSDLNDPEVMMEDKDETKESSKQENN